MSAKIQDIGSLKVSEAVRRLNPGLFAGLNIPPIVVKTSDLKKGLAGAQVTAPAKKRLRQSDKPVMNKLEERFYETKLRPEYVDAGQAVHIQAVRLELARGIWYKPDFFLPAVQHSDTVGRGAIAYEVKGPKVFRGGFENLKVAARVHPWVRFYLVWEDEDDGHWERQEILP